MTAKTTKYAAALLAMPLAIGLTPAAYAAKPQPTDTKIQALQQQLEDLQAEITELKQTQAQQAEDAKKRAAEAQAQAAEAKKKADDSAKVTMVNGRPGFSSADGNFTASIRMNGQADFAYYMQGDRGPGASTSDLSSGANLRRAEIGLQGTIYKDWSYMLLYELGGAGTDGSSTVLYSYLQYDGFGPWHIRAGVFAPPTNLDDSTSGANIMFLERNSSANVQRGIASAEGRDAISVIYTGDRVFGALSLSGGKVGGTEFDEQLAIVARASGIVYQDKASDINLLLNGNVVHVFKLPDTTAGSDPTQTITFSDAPELAVDSQKTKLVNTGALPASHVTSFAFEAAGNWKNFYLQGGYFGFQVDRKSVEYSIYSAEDTYATQSIQPSNNYFDGWYVQGAWTFTGESRKYVKSAGIFTMPSPAKPFSLSEGGWGAWELATRYSVLNLNDNIYDNDYLVTSWSSSSKSYNWYNTVRGGEQKIFTIGLNWYPNDTIRFMLDYMMTDVDRMSAPGTTTAMSLPAVDAGQSVQAIALRMQVAY